MSSGLVQDASRCAPDQNGPQDVSGASAPVLCRLVRDKLKEIHIGDGQYPHSLCVSFFSCSACLRSEDRTESFLNQKRGHTVANAARREGWSSKDTTEGQHRLQGRRRNSPRGVSEPVWSQHISHVLETGEDLARPSISGWRSELFVETFEGASW